MDFIYFEVTANGFIFLTLMSTRSLFLECEYFLHIEYVSSELAGVIYQI